MTQKFDHSPAFVALTAEGAKLARRLRDAFGAGEVHGRSGRVDGADVSFEETISHLQSLFREGRAIVGICAAGVLIRALSPLLADKRAEPPVLAVAENGSAVVPLLGGHHGANDLAKTLSAKLEVTAAITTASDNRFGIALDNPPAGWKLGNPGDYKAFMAEVLAGASVRLVGNADWVKAGKLPLSDDGELTITVTEKALAGSEKELVLHPAVLSLGVGCERNADAEELSTLVRETLKAEGLSEKAVAAVFSIDVKADETAVQALAAELDVPARFFPAAILEEQAPRLATPSDVVFEEVGCHGVSEGAALAAVGAKGQLLVAKHKSKRATCAVGQAPEIVEVSTLGQARGKLFVVGLGPGDQCWRAPEVDRVVRGVTDLVGYHLYLDLLGPLAEGKGRHGYELGEEEMRVRIALNLAAEGRAVALVCSGDPGIYAMAALTFELLDRGNRADWNRVAIQVTPGISALQGASARIGAPLGHDFCTISLSDLLTPWEAIEKRLNAAAQGDFVIAFYNPVSRRRTRQLATAVEILLKHRPADTPVMLGRNLGREGESMTVLRLDELTPDQVDMLTVVLVGSSTSRRIEKSDGSCWVYTPRGYEKKAHLYENFDETGEVKSQNEETAA
ncbi:precorrin-3B C(17)-methyltransferase [Kiloniella laminariae]|uniref:precorrin-3B C(17)-methyltransferase n=1 Tax=Kiloniella laminariae TaxID=454162 RepID=UPI000373E49F|nr:precorrin-3B C(17)-methyltransferase [Kiloniella laminariae]